MKKIVSIFLVLATYSLITYFQNLLYNLNNLHRSYLDALLIITPVISTLIKLAFSVAFVIIIFSLKPNSHETMKRKETGQYGNSNFTDIEELEDLAKVNIIKDSMEGIVLESDNQEFRIDNSDRNCLILAPPGVGKTKRFIIPTILANARYNKFSNGMGSSLILTDAKGEVYESTSKILEESGYKVIVLNFRNPLNSHRFNVMSLVNKHISEYNKLIQKIRTTKDEIKVEELKRLSVIEFGKAEKYTKILSDSIVNSNPNKTTSGADEFFTSASVGLLNSLILLISQYGKLDERHLISVYSLIIELNGISEDSSDMNQKNKLKLLFDDIQSHDNNIDSVVERCRNYAGATVSADVRTSMNVNSSALSTLSSLIDKELEQMLCSSTDDFDAEEFIEKPTAIFIIIPDENTTRHFMASLVIKNTINELIAIAETNKGKLKRKVIVLMDEFGNMPAIKDFDVVSTAARSRGIRIVTALQSYSQLDKIYGKERANIIRDAFQITIVGKLSPNATDDQKKLEAMAGHFTATSYSTSSGRNKNTFDLFDNSSNSSTSEQLIKKNLIEAFEYQKLAKGEFIVFLQEHIFKTNLDIIYDILDTKKLNDLTLDKLDYPIVNTRTIKKLTEAEIKKNAYIVSETFRSKKEVAQKLGYGISNMYDSDISEFY